MRVERAMEEARGACTEERKLLQVMALDGYKNFLSGGGKLFLPERVRRESGSGA